MPPANASRQQDLNTEAGARCITYFYHGRVTTLGHIKVTTLQLYYLQFMCGFQRGYTYIMNIICVYYILTYVSFKELGIYPRTI